MVSQISNMVANSDYRRRVAAESKRLRPVADAGFLEAVARHLADVARLPLKTARRRVQQLSVSATIKPAPGRPRADER
jgi:hypothetical protein